MDAEALAKVYAQWNETELNSYLLEITTHIFRQKDETDPTSPLIDMIRDQARQKGTGKWTSQEAMELMVPTSIIDTAVMMRDLSGCLTERKAVAEVLHRTETPFRGDGDQFVSQLRNALYVSMIMTYAQGMALLKEASVVYGYGLDLDSVARIWRGGCIIRAALLEDIRRAYETWPDLPNLMVDRQLSLAIVSRQEDLRTVVRTAVDLGLPAPGLMASLSYLDALQSVWLPDNLIQAQRDYFGAHTYERTDSQGVFHNVWS
jgi:6-phosphogluconate dehydrogenase